MLETPVALIIFRRPQLTERVFAAIARARPRKLFVIADGPRPDHPDDVEMCAAAREVVERVDWNCEVRKNYAQVNKGCGYCVASGITWLFEQLEEAIILEDDCVPHPSFFPFAQELLERYREDERVMHIAGCTYRPEIAATPYSYYFSQFNGAWGWATWRRAWQYYDLCVKSWAQLRDTCWLADLLGEKPAERYWSRMFQDAYERGGDIDTWDFQWTFACWANSGLSLVPRHNLVSNVGCGTDATHTTDPNDPTGNVPARAMSFPLIHPPLVLQNRNLDRKYLREIVIPRLPPARVASRTRLRRMLARFSPSFVKQSYRRLVSMVRSSLGTIALEPYADWLSVFSMT
jgi:hypothetical protein